jgi:hypothetical protein
VHSPTAPNEQNPSLPWLTTGQITKTSNKNLVFINLGMVYVIEKVGYIICRISILPFFRGG